VAGRKHRFAGGTIAAALVVAGLALGLFVSRPLPKYLTTGVPYTLAVDPDEQGRPGERVSGIVYGDHLQYMYHLGQLRLAAEGRAPWFRNTYEFAGGYGFTEFYLYFPTALPYWPLSYVSEAFAFNAVLLLSFVGTMVAGYGLARAWGADRGGAFCAGVVLTLFPARLASLFGGQPAGSAFFLFPMAWWGLEKGWQTGRAAWGWLAAACVALLARLEPHHLFYLCFLLPFWAFWKLAEAGTFAQPTTTEHATSRKRSLLDATPAFVAALLFAGCIHYNQIRLGVIPRFGPQIIALAVFFILVVAAMRWVIARVVGWLGVTDDTLRRRWLVLPWLAFLPLTFYFAAGALAGEGRFGVRIARACVVLFALAHVGFLIMAVNGKLLKPGKLTLPWQRIVKMWPAAVGLAIAVAYALYLKVAVFDVSGVKGGRTLHEIRLFSVPFRSLFTPATGNGDFVGFLFPLCVLLGFLMVRFGTREFPTDSLERRRFRISAGLFLLGLVLTCGPLLSAYLPLYEVLYNLVPFFNFTRATTKFAILTAVFGSVAVGLTLTFFARQAHRFKWLIWAAFLVGMIVIDHRFIPQVGVSVLPRENDAYAYVAQHSKDAPLLEIPIWPGDSAYSSIYQYWTLRTQVPTVNGYSPTVPQGYVEHIAWPLYDVNYGRFGPRDAALCERLGVRYVNFHEEAFPRQVSEFPATQSLKMLRLSPYLRLVADDGPVHLFEILDEPVEQPAYRTPHLTRYVTIDYLKKHVGREIGDTDAIDGRAWASDGRQGRLFFGPFAVLPTGNYTATFRVKAHAANAGDEIGTLDVSVESGTRVLAERKLTGSNGYQFVEIAFQLEGTHVVETRGTFAGTPDSSLALDYVFIQSTPPEGPIRIEAEEMFHAPARLTVDANASQGYCLEFEGPLKSKQTILEERLVLLDAGAYRVTCVARGSGSAPIATLALRRAGQEESFLQLNVTPGETPQTFAASSVAFDVAERGVYGVTVVSTGNGPDALDYIEIAPTD